MVVRAARRGRKSASDTVTERLDALEKNVERMQQALALFLRVYAPRPNTAATEPATTNEDEQDKREDRSDEQLEQEPDM